MNVCAECGVVVGQARDRWLHVDDFPKGVDYHPVVEVITQDEWLEKAGVEQSLRESVESLLAHHATIHPLAECAWAKRVIRVLRATA